MIANDAGHSTLVDVDRSATVKPKVPELPECVEVPPYVPVIVCVPVPTAEGVYVTEHDADVAVGEPSEHDELEKPPAPLDPNVTVPDGADAVPEPVSVTVAVHVDPWLSATEAGLQVTDVEVGLFVTVRSNVPALPEWALEPPYVPVIVCVPVPVAAGVYVTEHDAELAVGEATVHDVPGLENAPVPLEENVTVPVGADGVPEPVSVTVAVQVEPWLSATEAGLQLTVVDVGRTAGVSVRSRVNGEPVQVPLLLQLTVALDPASAT